MLARFSARRCPFAVRACVFAALAVLFPIACGDESGSAGPTEPPLAAPVASVSIVPATISVEEGASTTLSAVARDASGNSLSGRTVQWSTSDPGVATVTDAGVLTGVAAGPVTVTATVEGVEGRASGVVSLSRATVADIIQTQIVEPQWDDRFVLALVTETALPAGTVIGTVEPEASTTVFTVEEPSFFAFVDLVPTHTFRHPVVYVLVDALTGQVTEAMEFLQPSVDGEPIWLTYEDRIGSADRVIPASDTEPLKPVIPIPMEGATPSLVVPALGDGIDIRATVDLEGWSALSLELARDGKEGGKKVGFAIAGGPDGYFGPSRDDMTGVLKTFDFTVTEYNSTDHSVIDVSRDILAKTKDLGADDEVVIYINGHGGLPGLFYGQGQDENDSKWSYNVAPNASPLNNLPALLASIPAGKVILILDTCQAEALPSFIQTAGDDFKPKPGSAVHIFASAAKGESARGPSLGERFADLFGAAEARSYYTEGLVENISGTTDFLESMKAAHATQKNLSQKPPDRLSVETPLPPSCEESKGTGDQSSLIEKTSQALGGQLYGLCSTIGTTDVSTAIAPHPAQESGVVGIGTRRGHTTITNYGAGVFYLTDDDLAEARSRFDEAFPCPSGTPGDGVAEPAIFCPEGGVFPSAGLYWIAFMQTEAPLPPGGFPDVTERAFAMDSDGDPANNYTGPYPFGTSPLKDMDAVHVLEYGSGKALSYDLSGDGSPSQALFFGAYHGRYSVAVGQVHDGPDPGSDVVIPFRFSNFESNENFGFDGTAYSSDVEPPVSQDPFLARRALDYVVFQW